MMEDIGARKRQWGGCRPGAGRPRKSDPRYRSSKCETAGKRQYQNPTTHPIIEAEVTPEQIIAKIKYLIAEMRFFKSTDEHRLEYQLATLFNHRGDIPKPRARCPRGSRARAGSMKCAEPRSSRPPPHPSPMGTTQRTKSMFWSV
jgi:hypothetical protein